MGKYYQGPSLPPIAVKTTSVDLLVCPVILLLITLCLWLSIIMQEVSFSLCFPRLLLHFSPYDTTLSLCLSVGFSY